MVDETTEKLLNKLFKEDAPLAEISRVPTVSPSINWALQGGLVPGKFYMFWGPESSGKTMFTVACCAQMLKENPGGVIIWYDSERSWTKHWINIFLSDERGFTERDRTHRIKVEEAQYGREIFDHFLKKVVEIHDGGLKVLACVVDSIQSIIPPNEETRDCTEDALMGALARYLPGAMRQIVQPSRERDITWIFTSQVRVQMDQMKARLEGQYIFSGGKAFLHSIDAVLLFEQLKGKAHQIYDPEKRGMDENPLQIGTYVQARVGNKCRVGVPKRSAKFKFLYEQGVVDTWEEIANLALMQGVVKVEGKSYMYGELKIGVGIEDYKIKVKESEELQKELYNRVMELG